MIDWDALVVGPTIEAFGEPAIFAPSLGKSIPIVGVYDDEYFSQSPIGSMEQFGLPGNITAKRPVFGVRLAAFPPGVMPAQGDALTIKKTGCAYTVMEVHPDSHGWAKLLLNEAS